LFIIVTTKAFSLWIDNIMTKRKRTIYYLQNTLQATKYRATRTPPKTQRNPGWTWSFMIQIFRNVFNQVATKLKLNMASRSKCTSTLHQSFFFICHILYEYDWHNECPKWSSNRLPFQSTRVYSRYVVLLWFLCSVVVAHSSVLNTLLFWDFCYKSICMIGTGSHVV
jgi:hypothetical protein